ncbi:hypothetical protein [Leptolyngbya sp. NIES-2104]|uniref:hypothetical protein n=1 Tax=Leptolyngbya sp. NIES-2104 TaxID=1552121 RepID=UPI000AB36053|nr:hypothetical protein [Leptolyngbya sp. NIES-2104]
MAKTKGGKKKVYVHEHKRGDSTVKKHYRSTSNKPTKSSSSLGAAIFKLFGL